VAHSSGPYRSLYLIAAAHILQASLANDYHEPNALDVHIQIAIMVSLAVQFRIISLIGRASRRRGFFYVFVHCLCPGYLRWGRERGEIDCNPCEKSVV